MRRPVLMGGHPRHPSIRAVNRLVGTIPIIPTITPSYLLDELSDPILDEFGEAIFDEL